ncbi:GIY-YIG nuclease family protein [Paraburkholderia sp. DGU8]|uniref:GIY-YIG nuclease family protein n=1 Tax=Paraburkholderia sp. DGU8 TaxID=3161997 RepID=UPI0034675385
MKEACVLYLLMHAEAPVIKIGISQDVLHRCATIPHKIRFGRSFVARGKRDACRRAERILHHMLRQYRVDGLDGPGFSEWFTANALEQAKNLFTTFCIELGMTLLEPCPMPTSASGASTFARSPGPVLSNLMLPARARNIAETTAALGKIAHVFAAVRRVPTSDPNVATLARAGEQIARERAEAARSYAAGCDLVDLIDATDLALGGLHAVQDTLRAIEGIGDADVAQLARQGAAIAASMLEVAADYPRVD